VEVDISQLPLRERNKILNQRKPRKLRRRLRRILKRPRKKKRRKPRKLRNQGSPRPPFLHFS
jgi:hypothetical protein